MNTLFTQLHKLNVFSGNLTNHLDSIALLAIRLYVSWIFLPAGWLKTKDWDTTLFLFEEEYNVPLLSPEVAAWAGTFAEIFFPLLLILGVLTRYAAVGLFAVNIVAVLSLSEIAPAAFNEHITWGLGIAVVILWGAGRLSIDALLNRISNKPLS